MKKNILLGFLLIGTSAHAQFKTAPCKAEGYTSETCLIKEFQSSEEFYEHDFSNLRNLAKKYPELPWLSVLDSNNSLVKDLSDATKSIPRSDRGRFIDLLEKLKKSPNTNDLLEATEIFLKANPTEKFYFSNHDSNLMKTFAATLNGKENSSPRVQNRCTPNPEKYKSIMDDINRCGGQDIQSNSGLNFYMALAEIAACDKYNIEQIGVVETYRSKGLSLEKPCVIALKGASAAIGGGHIDIKTQGTVNSIEWSAGYDLTDKRNDLNFWRAQLTPKVNDLFKNQKSTPNANENSTNQGVK